MKPLLFTASAIALMMGTAACSQAASHAETTPPVAMETAAATPDQVKDEHAADLKETASSADLACLTNRIYSDPGRGSNSKFV